MKLIFYRSLPELPFGNGYIGFYVNTAKGCKKKKNISKDIKDFLVM